MRARWTVGELRRDLPADWTWSRQDVAEIVRRKIAAAPGTTQSP